MSTSVLIAQGEERITVELTVKEAMALSGYRFPQNEKQLVEARRKVKKALDEEVLQNQQTISYNDLAH